MCDFFPSVFSLDRVTKSPAVFDIKKLNWINGQHLRALPEEERAALIGAHLVAAGVATEVLRLLLKDGSHYYCITPSLPHTTIARFLPDRP